MNATHSKGRSVGHSQSKHGTTITRTLVVLTSVFLLAMGIAIAQVAPSADTTPPATAPTAIDADIPAAYQAVTALPSVEANIVSPAGDDQTATMPASTQPTTATAPASTQPLATTAPASTPAPYTRTPLRPAVPGAPITVNFKDVSLHSVLQYLSEMTGMVIIEAAPVSGTVSIMSGQPLSVEDTLKLLDTVLKDKGYAAIRVPPKTLKIVTADQAKRELVPVRNDPNPEKIQPSDMIITQIVPVQYVDAVRLKADLASVTPANTDVTSNAASNTLVVTGTESAVKHLMEIVRAIDVHTTDVSTVKVFPLKYANATTTARLITDIFKQDQNAGGASRGATGGGAAGRAFTFGALFGAAGGGAAGGRGGRGGANGAAGGAAGATGADTGGGPRTVAVTASADDRTNSVVVSASPEMMVAITKVVEELDKNPVVLTSVYVYHLKNADSGNVQGILNNIFGFTGSTSGGASTANRTLTGGNTFGGSTSGGGRGGSSGGSSMRGLSTGSLGGASSTINRTTGGTTAGRSTSAGGTASTSDLAGQVYVVADTATNSLLVTVSPANWERVKAIIADLDRAVPQVLIKCLIAEVTHDNSLDLGVEFSGMNLPEFKVGTNFNILQGNTIPVNNPANAGFIFSLNEKYVTAAVHALANTTKLDVLSRPYILTSDNQEAQIMIGQSVPYVTSSLINGDTGSTTNTVQYQDIGIILDVTPHINPQGLVTLDVYPEISSISDSTVQTTPGVNATVFNKRFAQSRVAIRDGQTIVIGGMMQDNLTKTVDKVPLLGDIPVLGLLFQHSVEKKSKTELLIFLTPHVALQPDELKAMSEDEKAGLKAIPNAVEPGAYQEHMRGMERGASTRPVEGDLERPMVNEIAAPTTAPAAGEPIDQQQLQQDMQPQVQP